MNISKYNWYLLLPISLLPSLPPYISSLFCRDFIQAHANFANHLFWGYLLLLLLLLALVTFKLYKKIPGRIFVLYNLINLGETVALCLLFDLILPKWQWFFYMLTSYAHHIIIWAGLFLRQFIFRFILLFKDS